MIEEYVPGGWRDIELPRFVAAFPVGANFEFADDTLWSLDRSDLKALIETLAYGLEQSEKAEERACSGS